MKAISNHLDRKGLVSKGFTLWPIAGHTREIQSGQDGSMPSPIQPYNKLT